MAVAIRFDTAQLPWFTLWKNTQAEEDGYCTGLEPGSSFPNLRMFEREQGRVISLGSKQEVKFEFSVSVALAEDDVASLVAEVDEIQGGTVPVVHAQPKGEWSAS